jgi:DNA-binding HxlR family transcriptional regulator
MCVKIPVLGKTLNRREVVTMLKTQEEVLEWLLRHEEGNYKELVSKAGKVLTRQLELLGYIRRGANSQEDTYALTRRGRRVAEATIHLKNALEREETKPMKKERRIRKKTRFEKLILSRI